MKSNGSDTNVWRMPCVAREHGTGSEQDGWQTFRACGGRGCWLSNRQETQMLDQGSLRVKTEWNSWAFYIHLQLQNSIKKLFLWKIIIYIKHLLRLQVIRPKGNDTQQENLSWFISEERRSNQETRQSLHHLIILIAPLILQFSKSSKFSLG